MPAIGVSEPETILARNPNVVATGQTSTNGKGPTGLSRVRRCRQILPRPHDAASLFKAEPFAVCFAPKTYARRRRLAEPARGMA
jgi:hypothetical protein